MSGRKEIVFICSLVSSDKILERICRLAETDIKFLAASSNIKLEVADANDFTDASYIAVFSKYVTLEYELMATQSHSNHDSKAVYARLTFETYFSNAVEKG